MTNPIPILGESYESFKARWDASSPKPRQREYSTADDAGHVGITIELPWRGSGSVKMVRTDWATDEHGNPWRQVMGK